MDIQIVLGTFPILLGFASCAWYYREIFAGRIKPHAFSWLVWGTTTGIAFVAQILNGAGPGAWFLGYVTLNCFVTFGLALWKGERSFPAFDWISLLVALSSLIPWYLSNDATISVVIVTFIDTCGYLPTFRKIYRKPREESLFVFATGIVQYAASLFALSVISISTALYPLVCTLMNIAVCVQLLYLRQKKTPR